MAQVHIDPEAVRAFAHMLNEFCDETNDGVSRVRSHLNDLGTSTWTDEQYQAYSQMLEEVLAQLNRVIARIQPEHMSQLEALARRADAVLGR